MIHDLKIHPEHFAAVGSDSKRFELRKDDRPYATGDILRLRDRCQKVYDKIRSDAMLRQGSPADSLVEFVISERGRAADPALDQALPLVLYFGTPEDRDEFMALMREAKPNMVTRAMP